MRRWEALLRKQEGSIRAVTTILKLYTCTLALELFDSQPSSAFVGRTAMSLGAAT